MLKVLGNTKAGRLAGDAASWTGKHVGNATEWATRRGGEALEWAGKQRQRVIDAGGNAFDGTRRQGGEVLELVDNLLFGWQPALAGMPNITI